MLVGHFVMSVWPFNCVLLDILVSHLREMHGFKMACYFWLALHTHVHTQPCPTAIGEHSLRVGTLSRSRDLPPQVSMESS